jgi:hypothetical protein
MALVHPHGTIGIVTRRVERSPAVVDLVLGAAALAPAGPFVVVVPFRPLPPALGTWGWRAEARLRWSTRPLHPGPAVRIELTAWSSTETELCLAPVEPHALRWSDRRWNRYFGLAHDTADAVVTHLTATATGLPDRPPVAAAQNWNVF